MPDHERVPKRFFQIRLRKWRREFENLSGFFERHLIMLDGSLSVARPFIHAARVQGLMVPALAI